MAVSKVSRRSVSVCTKLAPNLLQTASTFPFFRYPSRAQTMALSGFDLTASPSSIRLIGASVEGWKKKTMMSAASCISSSHQTCSSHRLSEKSSFHVLSQSGRFGLRIVTC
ncbi:hypothetical protein V3481_003567 [Fusarium oxysporum f. sp. vasinfectum]